MKDALFFACDEGAKTFLQARPLDGLNYRFTDLDINDEQVKHLQNLQNVEVLSLFAHAEPVKTKQLDCFPHLKMIATRSTGFNHLDLDYCKKRNIIVSNVPNYGATAVAEFTLGIIIALMRKITLAKSQMKTNNVNMTAYIGESIKNKKVGVIGTGAIGRAVIALLKAFEAQIIAYDPYPNDSLIEQGIKYTSLEKLLEESDIITLHCPATKDNFHLLNQKAFSKMKTGAYIINTARGSLIDTESLYLALQTGKIAGAGLDVLENEDVLVERELSLDAEKRPAEFLLDSVINFKMLQLNNTIITPHIAFSSTDAIEKIMQTTFENIQAFINGSPINVVS